MITANTLEILEFDKLLGLISGHANSEASGKSILGTRPLSDKTEIEKKQHETAETRKLSHEGNPLAIYPFPDISLLLQKVKPEGSVLEALELAGFIPVFDIGVGISRQMKDRFDLPYLQALTSNLTGFPDILKTLKKSIDSEGNILDSASFLLADLRAQIRKIEAKIRKRLEEIVRDERVSALLQDDFITVRSGRWVIPVRMDSKGMVPGVVHDVSKSGETAFIEPLGIIHLANELENIIAEQKAEEIRILRNICSMIRKVNREIEEEFKTIVYLDTLNCIAKFSDTLDMQNPAINTASFIRLTDARHPLLQLSLQRHDSGNKVVPLTAQLGGENTVMVITGANAGGKTIAIKTIGLTLLMALSGMPVPASSSSSLPLIKKLLIDIGDEQSIENNLSTFSAHISNLSGILENTSTDTVVLVDELGTGTDPEEGAAISCAILNELRKSGSLVFATTHLAEIKGFVHRTEGMLNASMEFDRKTFTPLYTLRVGEPGLSHAIETARKYGLPEHVITEAKGMLGNVKLEFDNLISDLNEKRGRHEQALVDLGEQKKQLDSIKNELDNRTKEIAVRQREVLAETYKKAAEILADTKRQMNTFLEELKKKGKADARRIMKETSERQKFIEKKISEYAEPDREIPAIESLKRGDMVYVKSLGHDAVITEINLKTRRLKVASGNMEIEIPVDETRYGKGSEAITEKTPLPVSADEEIPVSINLVGLRVDDALSQLEQTLNHASLADMRELTVIHGIGKGILMKAIHEHLTGHPLIKKFRSANQEEGGKAITLVTLK